MAARSRSSGKTRGWNRSEEHTSELQSQSNLVCRLLLEKKKKEIAHNISRFSYNTNHYHLKDTRSHSTLSCIRLGKCDAWVRTIPECCIQVTECDRVNGV